MKFASGFVTMASGSIGGMTASHNRFGRYLRSKVVPVNPATARQVAVRNYLSQLAARWKDVLTADQRAAWEDYAVNTPRTDVLGSSQVLTGLNWYLACNVVRLQAGLSIVDDGPTTFGMADMSPITATITASTGVAAITFVNTDDWATEVGGALLIFGSIGKSPSINFFKGPYRFADSVAGAAVAPTSPASVTLADNVAAGQRVFLKAVAIRADGRISSPFRLVGVAA